MSNPALEHYLDVFAKHNANTNSPVLKSIQQKGLDEFRAHGFPTRRMENWKYTDVKPLASQAFELVDTSKTVIDDETIDNFRFQKLDCYELVFVNGQFCADKSVLPESGSIVICGLTEALEKHEGLIKTHLAHYALTDGNPFVSLNNAFVQDGCLIHINADTVVDKPVHLLYLTAGSGHPLSCQLRNLVIMDRNSQASIIENYCGIDESTYFNNTVTEILLENGANLEHYKLQQESVNSYHIGNLQIKQLGHSQMVSHSVSLGGSLVRNDIHARLEQPGCSIHMNGLYLAGGKQHVDNHTRVDHLQPETTSREIYRGVLDNRARGVFNGKVVVHKDAQKTNAEQSNANLLLSSQAEIDTKPELEIYADDVKCAHGATVGQLDENMLFYLRSRAIDETVARSILTYAFAGEIISNIRLQPVRDKIARAVIGQLPDADLIREFVV